MGKLANDIVKWGVIRPFFDKNYKFNSIDIETIENELFLFGYVNKGEYSFTLTNFFDTLHNFLIDSLRNGYNILTWSRYDNTHLLKLIFKDCQDIKKTLLKIGKISPIYEYTYKNFTVSILNVIKDSIIFKFNDNINKPKTITIYNLKNLFTKNLETTAHDYKIDWYSKMGQEYHIINKQRFNLDNEYKRLVIKSNELDNKVIIKIACIFLNDFKDITGYYPKSIFTAGSIARSYLLAYNKNGDQIDLHFRAMFTKSKKRDLLLDYAMKSYHGGKIESYILGYVKSGYIIDITSAYPYAMSKLPKPINKIYKGKGKRGLDTYFYAFIRCDIQIDNENLIHPVIMESPINKSNISPYGYLKNIIITKPEYDYMIKNGCKIKVYDYIATLHDDSIYPYKNLVNDLFNKRIEFKNNGDVSKSELFKTILNSLYGISYELTDVFKMVNGEIVWRGFRAGDYFNPLIASYITALTRTYLSDVSYNIIKNGGDVYLNMTDSIILNGKITLDVFSDKKILGKFERPEKIKDIIILGAGRYEYKSEFTNKYVIKNRGFNVSVKDKSFYSNLDLSDNVSIDHITFISSFRATTKKYDYQQMGHLLKDKYIINPFNLGGKRVIQNYNVNLKTGYTKTKPVYIDKDY